MLRIGRRLGRKTVIYARVLTSKQEVDLENQISTLKQFCIVRGWRVSEIYSDVASALNFDKRIGFSKLIDKVMNYEVERVVVVRRDRLTRIFGTEIIVIEEKQIERK